MPKRKDYISAEEKIINELKAIGENNILNVFKSIENKKVLDMFLNTNVSMFIESKINDLKENENYYTCSYRDLL